MWFSSVWCVHNSIACVGSFVFEKKTKRSIEREEKTVISTNKFQQFFARRWRKQQKKLNHYNIYDFHAHFGWINDRLLTTLNCYTFGFWVLFAHCGHIHINIWVLCNKIENYFLAKRANEGILVRAKFL